MVIQKLALILPLSVFASTIVHANTANYCPRTNIVAPKSNNAFFWRCATADGNCQGNDTFIGATLVNYEGGPRYFCSYSGNVKDSIVSRHRFSLPSPDQTNFKDKWRWMEGADRIVCQSSDPRDCPVTAFHEQG